MKLSRNRVGKTSQTGKKEAKHFFNSLSSIIMVIAILLFLFVGACDYSTSPEQDKEIDSIPETAPVESEDPEVITGLDDLLLVSDLEGYPLPVTLDNKLWLINTRGEMINSRPLDLDSAIYELLFEHGVEPILVDRTKWDFLNEKGEPLFNERYEHIYVYEDGFIVDLDGMYGFLGTDGRPVEDLPLFDSYIPPEIPGTCNPDAMNVAPGYTMLNRGGLWAVNRNNRMLTDFIFEEVMDWGQPVIFDGIVQMIAREKGRATYGLFNLDSGSYIIPPDKFDEVHYLKSDRARVLNENLYGFVDSSGEMVIDTRYDYATVFEHQVAAVIEDDLLSFIDRDGSRLVEPVEVELEAYHWLFIQYIEGPDLYRSVDSSYFNLDGWIRKPE